MKKPKKPARKFVLIEIATTLSNSAIVNAAKKEPKR